MTDPIYAFAPPAPVAVPIDDMHTVFPVRRIYCVGRNYAEHIREMGGDERALPFFFQKPTDSIVIDGSSVPYPPATEDFQHEIELVLAIGKGGADIEETAAVDHVFGLAVGIDLTRRDLQLTARKAGRPWESGKSFDQSAPISSIKKLGGQDLPGAGSITLEVNGALRQSGDLREMIWSPAEIVSALSRQFRLEPGDLIYTGTPAGVGPVIPGDVVSGYIDGVGSIEITIAEDRPQD